MSLRAQLSVAVAATAAVGGIAPAAADSSTSTATSAVVNPAKLGTNAPLAPVPAAPAGPLSHTVQRGETLSRIARQYGTTVAAIAQANGITNPARIYAGKTLTIPGAATAVSATPQNPVPKTFLHYTYPDSTNSAANANKLALERAAVPSRAQMQEIVRSTAAQMGVDPRLALAHAYVESGFDMRSVSPANAIGVMQVIPSSGEWASRLVGRPLNLLDPHDNAVAGVAIIRYLQRNANSVDQGIAGYYQGLGGVRKNGMRPDTVAYVNRVKAAQARF